MHNGRGFLYIPPENIWRIAASIGIYIQRVAASKRVLSEAAGHVYKGRVLIQLGTFLIPVLLFGTLLGACIGAGLGAWALEFAIGEKWKNLFAMVWMISSANFLASPANLPASLSGFIVAIAAFWP